MPKGIPIGFEMAEKNANKQTNTQTDKHFRIYISRDLTKQNWEVNIFPLATKLLVNMMTTILMIARMENKSYGEA